MKCDGLNEKKKFIIWEQNGSDSVKLYFRNQIIQNTMSRFKLKHYANIISQSHFIDSLSQKLVESSRKGKTLFLDILKNEICCQTINLKNAVTQNNTSSTRNLLPYDPFGDPFYNVAECFSEID